MGAHKTKRVKKPPVYLRAVKLIDPETGQLVSAFIPASATDVHTIRDRRITIGNMVRCEMTKPRSLEYHRLCHALGTLLVQNIEAFRHCNAHTALKKLQVDSGIECDETQTDVPGFGVLVTKQPRSIAFDQMDQGQFFQMISALCGFVAETYWPDLEGTAVEEMLMGMMNEGKA